MNTRDRIEAYLPRHALADIGRGQRSRTQGVSGLEGAKAAAGRSYAVEIAADGCAIIRPDFAGSRRGRAV